MCVLRSVEHLKQPIWIDPTKSIIAWQVLVGVQAQSTNDNILSLGFLTLKPLK